MKKKIGKIYFPMPELSETIQRGDLEIEELSGKLTKTCIGLLDGRDRRFAEVLSNGRIFESVSAALTRYLERIEEAHPSEVMQAVGVTINDYLERFGIGLMSCRVEPLNADRDSMILRDEKEYPTIGVLPEDTGSRLSAKIATFQVENGGEELTALTDNLCLRGYLPGEQPPRFEISILPVQKGASILIPQKAAVGVRVPFVERERLFKSGFFRNVRSLIRDNLRIEKDINPGPGQVYFCRYLTRQAVAEALGL